MARPLDYVTMDSNLMLQWRNLFHMNVLDILFYKRQLYMHFNVKNMFKVLITYMPIIKLIQTSTIKDC